MKVASVLALRRVRELRRGIALGQLAAQDSIVRSANARLQSTKLNLDRLLERKTRHESSSVERARGKSFRLQDLIDIEARSIEVRRAVELACEQIALALEVAREEQAHLDRRRGDLNRADANLRKIDLAQDRIEQLRRQTADRREEGAAEESAMASRHRRVARTPDIWTSAG